MCARRHLGDVISTHPTVGSNVEEVTHRNVRFQVWDLGGQDKLRKVWATYYCGAHAVVLVVDSTDRARLNVVRDELAAITSHEVCCVECVCAFSVRLFVLVACAFVRTPSRARSRPWRERRALAGAAPS